MAFLTASLETDALLLGAGLFASGLLAMEVFSLWQPVSGEPSPEQGAGSD